MLKILPLIAVASFFIWSPAISAPIINDQDIKIINSLDDKFFNLKMSQFEIFLAVTPDENDLTRFCLNKISDAGTPISLADTEILFDVASRMETERDIVISTLGAAVVLDRVINNIRLARIRAKSNDPTCKKVNSYNYTQSRLLDQITEAEDALVPISSRIVTEAKARMASRVQ